MESQTKIPTPPTATELKSSRVVCRTSDPGGGLRRLRMAWTTISRLGRALTHPTPEGLGFCPGSTGHICEDLRVLSWLRQLVVDGKAGCGWD